MFISSRFTLMEKYDIINATINFQKTKLFVFKT